MSEYYFIEYDEYEERFKEDACEDACDHCVFEHLEPNCLDRDCEGGLYISTGDVIPQDSAWQPPEEKTWLPEDKPLKYDDDKPLVELVLGGFANALLEVANVGTMGAKKYSPNGWKENTEDIEDKISRIDNAKGRHRLAYQSGELLDPESKLLHRAHEAWNVLAALELEILRRGKGE